MSFPGFYPFSNWERESGKQNLGVKEKCPQSYLSYFRRGSTGEFFFFHGLIDFVLFLVLAWRIFGVLRVSVSLLSLTRSKMAMVRQPRALLKNYLFLCLTSAEGKGTPLPFWGPSQSFGFSLFPLPMSGDLRSLKCEHLVYPAWPTFSLNGHFLTARKR